MKTKYTNKQIWMIAYPILISLLMEQMIGMTDTAFLGRVGEVELGASAIAGVFYMVIFMAAFGFSIGAQILIARRNGEKQYREIGDLFYQGIYFQIGLAAVMFLLSYFLSPMILKRIVSSEHIYEAAISYLNWRVFGAFFSFSAVIFRAFFLGTTQTKTLTLNSIVMVLSNVVFNYILIFGKFGAPQLGIAGAAIGSSLAEMVSVIFFVIYYIISSSGEKMAKEGTWEAFYGTWLSAFVLAPVAIYLTYKATNDSGLLDVDWYVVKFKKIKEKISGIFARFAHKNKK